MRYPAARRLDLVDERHGHRIPDPYRWLEDPDSAETQDWLTAQDDLVRAHLDGLPGRDHLARRLTELLDTGFVGAPAWRGDRSFFLRRDPGQEHAVLHARDGGGESRVLVDPVAVDPTGTTTLDGWSPDHTGRQLAYQLSTGGDEESRLRVLDVDRGEIVDGPIDRTRYSPVAWVPDGSAFYYVRRLPPDQVPAGEDQFHRRVWRHTVGSDPAADTLIWGEGLEKTNYYGVSLSRDGRWLVLTASAGTAPRTDVWIADLQGDGEPRPVQVGVDAQTWASVGRDGRLYLLTDRDAPRRRLCVTAPERPGFEHCTDLVPEDPEAVLEDTEILDTAGLLVAVRTRHAVAEVHLHDLVTGEARGPIPLPGLGSVTALTGRHEGGAEAWLGYTDHRTPSQVLHHDARTGTTTVVADAPGAAVLPDVTVDQVTYASADGTPVRMFVIAPSETPDTPRPTVLYGYGGFNVPLTPGFSAGVLAWVEAGGVYAIANLRGGSEEGEDWHRAGMRESKTNVFDDFTAAAEHLIATGWTTSERLGISGGSNGGLLVGAAMTRRPELFAAVVCSAPLLDMVRYELFGLGQTWNDEYGTADDPTELGWLLSYSPYHHVRDGVDYPATLFTVFDSDTRVDPLHARKMCAALQSATSGDRPVLLRRERDVGHGARSISRTVALSVDTAAFLAAHTGLALP